MGLAVSRDHPKRIPAVRVMKENGRSARVKNARVLKFERRAFYNGLHGYNMACLLAWMHACVHLCTHARVEACAHCAHAACAVCGVCLQVHMGSGRMNAYFCARACACVRAHACVQLCMCACVGVCVCVHVCTCVCTRACTKCARTA